MMTIRFFLDSDESLLLTSLIDVPSNPFNLNDEIDIHIEDVKDVELGSFRDDLQLKIRDDNESLTKKFNAKKIKLRRQTKNMTFSTLSVPKITIQYFCQLIN